MTCRHVAQPIPHGVAPQQSPATLRLRGKDSDLEQTPDTKPQIFSLQFDPLDYNSFFPACILTYTPKLYNGLHETDTIRFLDQQIPNGRLFVGLHVECALLLVDYANVSRYR